MSGDNFSASQVRVGDQSSFRQGHDFHAPVTILTQAAEQYVRTPLHDAVASNDETEVERLLSEGANINACDTGGYTPINIAIWNGDDDMVKFLLDKGAPVENLGPTMPPLHAAILNSNLELTKLLLDRGANKEKRSGNQTALAVAAGKGEAEIVALLLERGSNLNARNTTGRTPLFGAVYSKSAETVKLLLQHGAKPSQADFSGSIFTIIKHDEAMASVFRTYGSKEVVEKLESNEREEVLRRIKASRFDVNNAGDRDRALIYFAKIKREREVKLLLQLGANVTATETGVDAARYAVAVGNESIVRLLLDAGADVRRVYPPDNTTLLHAAISSQNVALAKMLLDRGADVNAKDRNMWTPLHHSTIFSNEQLVTLLLDYGADPLLKDNAQRTAIQRAAAVRSENIVRILQERANRQSRP